MMKIVKEQKGFTLIELALVLVIIGIILGAVLKGQDLIEGAKVKKVINFTKKWEIPIWAHYDKKGYFPGDTDATKDGLIDTFTALKSDLDTAKLAYPADTEADVKITINEVATVCGSTSTRNIMLLENVPLDYAKQFDTSNDGAEDGEKGRVRYCGPDGDTDDIPWPATDPTVITYLFDKTL